MKIEKDIWREKRQSCVHDKHAWPLANNPKEKICMYVYMTKWMSFRGSQERRKFIEVKIFMDPVIEKLLWVVSLLTFVFNIILPFSLLFCIYWPGEKFTFLFFTLLLLLFNSQRVTLDNVHALFHAMKIVFFLLLHLIPAVAFHFILFYFIAMWRIALCFRHSPHFSYLFGWCVFIGRNAYQGMEFSFDDKFVEINIIFLLM